MSALNFQQAGIRVPVGGPNLLRFPKVRTLAGFPDHYDAQELKA